MLPRPTLVFGRFRAVSCNMALFLAIIALPVAFLTLNGVVPGGRRRVFLVLLLLLILFLLFLVSSLDGLIGAERSKGLAVGLLYFLGLGSLAQGSLAVVPWVCTFEKILWDGRWPLGQRTSESLIMVLDLRPASVSALTVF